MNEPAQSPSSSAPTEASDCLAIPSPSLQIRRTRGGFRTLIRRVVLASNLRPRKSEVEANADISHSDALALNEVKKYIQREQVGRTVSMANSYQRQISATGSRSQLNMESPNCARNYIISNGEIRFWKNYAFEQEVSNSLYLPKSDSFELTLGVRQIAVLPPSSILTILSGHNYEKKIICTGVIKLGLLMFTNFSSIFSKLSYRWRETILSNSRLQRNKLASISLSPPTYKTPLEKQIIIFLEFSEPQASGYF